MEGGQGVGHLLRQLQPPPRPARRRQPYRQAAVPGGGVELTGVAAFVHDGEIVGAKVHECHPELLGVEGGLGDPKVELTDHDGSVRVVVLILWPIPS